MNTSLPRSSRRVPAVVEQIERRLLLSASLVKDSNSLGLGSNPDFVDLNGVTLFAASDQDHGTELWRTDGTAAGTSLVKDIVPGQASSWPQDLVQFNGVVYFTARGSDGSEIWMTDGTTAGTTEVAAPGDPRDIQDLTPVGNKLFFIQGNNALWVTDGTPGNAHQVSSPSFVGVVVTNYEGTPGSLLPAGNDVSFEGITPDFNYGLFKTDGTAAGTTLVQSLGGIAGYDPVPVITAAGGKVLFNAAGGSAVWETDGTARGTVSLIPAGATLTGHAVVFNNEVYFAASSGAQGAVWKTDGTARGTVVLAPGSDPAVSGKYLYYMADSSAGGSQLYRTDGTPTGTMQLTSLHPYGIFSEAMTDVNGELFFSALVGSSITDSALWKSDGTAAGTGPVNVTVPAPGLDPSNLAGIGGTLYFSADDGIHGRQAWKSDGTAAGTVMVQGATIGATSGNDTMTISVGPGDVLVANINGTTTTYTPAQYAGGITIDTGSSSGTGDVMNILGLPAVATLVQSEGPLAVTVGSDARGMQDIAATTLAIGNRAAQGSVSLKFNDAADPTGKTVTLDTTRFGTVPYGTIYGLSARLIEYNAAEAVSPVIVNAPNAGNHVIVNNTPAGPVINLNTGTGNDTVDVHGTASGTVLNINGVAGKDAVNVTDQNSVQNILGVVNVSNPLGQTDLTIDDSADTTSRNLTLDTFAAPGATYGSLQGLAPAPINFAGVGLHSLTVNLSGHTQPSLTVKNTPGGGPITFNELDTASVLGVAAGQELDLGASESAAIHGVINIDFSTGRIGAGSNIFADCYFLNVTGASASDAFTLGGGPLMHGTTSIRLDTNVLDVLKLTRGSLTVTDNLSGTAPFTLQVDGADTSLTIASSQNPQTTNVLLSITNGARAAITHANSVSVLGLTLDGYLDIGTGNISWGDSGTDVAQKVRNLIASGLAGGRGITTSAADSIHTVGFTTQPEGTGRTSVRAQYALYGDANLDGKVDFADLVILASHYGQSNATWNEGDFNYDGKVGFEDLVKLAQTYQQTQKTPAALAAFAQATPTVKPAPIRRRR